MPTYRVITLGCKVNQYESLQVQELLKAHGYTPASGETADLVLVNTCSVTSAAGAKSRYMVRKYAKAGVPTIALGCYATSHTQALGAIPGVQAVVGHQDAVAEELATLLASRAFHPCPKPAPPELPVNRNVGTASLPLLSARQTGNQRAILKIQDGCDAHCTYCIIPRLRPTLFSRAADEVIQEAGRMVAAGHREIVLAGVFLGAYGQPTALHRRQHLPSAPLGQLVRRLCDEVPGLLRIRLSSLEPGDVSDELIATLASHPQVMPHFHLPLQSGSETVLRRMNRQYTRADYLATVHRLRDAFDRPAITTDIIVGFPGESDDDFAQTFDACLVAKFLHIHAFPFSPREGTPAARWRKQMIPQRIASERMRVLSELAARLSLEYRKQFIGEEMSILVEDPGSTDHDDSMNDGGVAPTASVRHGRCERYFSIHVDSAAVNTGDLVRVRVDRVTPHRTLATILGSL